MATPKKSRIGENGSPEYIPKLHAPLEIGEVNSIEHTARIFGVSVAVITQLHRSGALRATRVSARNVVFSRAAIMAFIADRTEEQPAPYGSGNDAPDLEHLA